ncbi:MAG: hypothetical protein KA149_00505 [Chitinophagales bacterium]|nr:hypothetical protein [Chitinophagales bacterium]
MKKLAFTLLTATFLFAGCSKVNEALEKDTVVTPFADTYANTNDGSRDNSFRKTNMKIVIRPVNNAINTYRLVVKVDSIAVDVNGTPVYVDVPAEATIKAGLSKQDPNNIDLDKVVFAKDQLTFRKENENGYAVFVSDPFSTDEKFDYQLVKVNLGITTNFAVLLGKPLDFNETEMHMVLPGGRTVIQNPEPEKMIINVKNNGTVNLQLAISGDPAQTVTVTAVVRVNFNPGEGAAPPAPPTTGTLTPVIFNKNTGVSVWRATVACLTYYNPETGEWKCADNLAEGGIMLYLMDANGKVISSHFVDDWQGETAF